MALAGQCLRASWLASATTAWVYWHVPSLCLKVVCVQALHLQSCTKESCFILKALVSMPGSGQMMALSKHEDISSEVNSWSYVSGANMGAGQAITEIERAKESHIIKVASKPVLIVDKTWKHTYRISMVGDVAKRNKRSVHSLRYQANASSKATDEVKLLTVGSPWARNDACWQVSKMPTNAVGL